MTRLEELNEAWCKHMNMNKCSTEIMQALAFALRWCEEHPHWISVEDELPPYKDENKKHSIEVLGWYGENMVDRIYYDYGDEMWFDSFFYRNPPTHWMPLPQAPKGGGRSPESELQNWMRL